MSLALSDAQIAHIQLVSRPLPPKERGHFMLELFETLLNQREAPGDGELSRLLRDLQHRHFRPPSSTDEREITPTDNRAFQVGDGMRVYHLRRKLAAR